MSRNYLFGPFIGEAIYELSYFVGHAIYLRKKNPKNKIIVFTREEHFDFYGKYATIFIPLRLDKDLIPYKFGCDNMTAKFYDELIRQFASKYKSLMRIHDHFYPKITSYLKDIKWHYPRNEVNFDFMTRPYNKIIASDILGDADNIILSDLSGNCTYVNEHFLLPTSYFFRLLDIDKKITSIYGILIEAIKCCKYVHADIDSVVGRLAMLMKIPLITQREFLDVQYLNPINPYNSIVVGCEKLEDGIKYLEETYENNI